MVDKEGAPTPGIRPQVLVVDDDWETLNYVEDNLLELVGNLMRVNQMQSEDERIVEENAKLFEKNLEPLFSLISATARDHLMDKFSGSLKKALLLMAMDRFSCDSDLICNALGLTRPTLERELKRCGLLKG